MKSKLTITLNKALLEKVEQYAAAHETTASHLIEKYLKSLAAQEKPEPGKDI